MFKLKKEKKAFTFAEVMIAVILMSFLGLAISKLMSTAQMNAARGRCKAMLRQNMKLASMYLQKDISSSRVIYNEDNNQYKMTLELGDGSSSPFTKIEVPKRGNTTEEEDISFFDTYQNEENPENALYDTVSYQIEDGKLIRKLNNVPRKIAEKITYIGQPDVEAINPQLSYNGKIELRIKLKSKIEGSPEELEYEEPLIISVRQLQNKINFGDVEEKKVDNHWKQRIGKDNF